MKLDASAGLLFFAIRDPRFLVGLVVAESVLAHTLNPSRTLQKKDGDLVSAYALIRENEYQFTNFRVDAREHFHAAFKRAKDLLIEVDSVHDDVSVPRVRARQTQRANVPAATADEYYRRSVYVPFLDQVIDELKSRFDDSPVPVALRSCSRAQEQARMPFLKPLSYNYNRTMLSHWLLCGRRYSDGISLQSLRLLSLTGIILA